jgi:chaperonin GroES
VKRPAKAGRTKAGAARGAKSPGGKVNRGQAPAAKTRPGAAPATSSSRGGQRMPKVRPLHDRVLVRRIEEGEARVGGIIVPDSAKEKPQKAEVVAAGSGRVLENGDRVPLTLKAGDKVLVGKWAGTEVKIDGEEYLILKEDEILGILG